MTELKLWYEFGTIKYYAYLFTVPSKYYCDTSVSVKGSKQNYIPHVYWMVLQAVPHAHVAVLPAISYACVMVHQQVLALYLVLQHMYV